MDKNTSGKDACQVAKAQLLRKCESFVIHLSIESVQMYTPGES